MPAPRSKPARRFAPEAVRSTRELADLQRAMWTLISRPLNASSRMRRKWRDGRTTASLAAQIARPNDRLSSVERLEIYSRMYWFRILDSLYDDCPGLRAVLGDRRFLKLAEAYFARYPSRSFSMRNLPSRLARFIREEPRWTAPHTDLCVDVARFEWARIEVFDSAALPVFTADDLLDSNPARLKLNLQPYLRLLKLDHPVDDFLLAVQQRSELSRGESSNTTITALAVRASSRRPKRPAREATFVAVHRMRGMLYFKRLDPAAYRVLAALARGRTLVEALSVGIPRAKNPRADWPAKVQGWFRNWMELGWFCRR
jgi:hypothetical protein